MHPTQESPNNTKEDEMLFLFRQHTSLHVLLT